MIRLAAGDQLERCGAMVVEHLSTGGKRLRARLALQTAEALGVHPEVAVGWAAACELLHNASLVHDDLQDGDTMRRGRPTTWVRYGAGQAINAGDLMLMLPTLAVEHVPVDDGVRWRLSRALATYAAHTVRGQSREMTLLKSRRLAWSEYEHAAVGKTGAFFALPVYGSLLIAGFDDRQAGVLAGHFSTLGLIFQMADDLLDLFGDKGRATAGDVREGKVTALVVEHVAGSPEDEDWLMEVLGKDRDETTDADIDAVRLRFRDGGAVDEVLERIYALSKSIFECEELQAHRGLYRVAASMLLKTLDPIRHLEPSLPMGAEAR